MRGFEGDLVAQGRVRCRLTANDAAAFEALGARAMRVFDDSRGRWSRRRRVTRAATWPSWARGRGRPTRPACAGCRCGGAAAPGGPGRAGRRRGERARPRPGRDGLPPGGARGGGAVGRRCRPARQTLDAIAAGRPVVATPLAVRGIRSLPPSVQWRRRRRGSLPRWLRRRPVTGERGRRRGSTRSPSSWRRRCEARLPGQPLPGRDAHVHRRRGARAAARSGSRSTPPRCAGSATGDAVGRRPRRARGHARAAAHVGRASARRARAGVRPRAGRVRPDAGARAAAGTEAAVLLRRGDAAVALDGGRGAAPRPRPPRQRRLPTSRCWRLARCAGCDVAGADHPRPDRAARHRGATGSPRRSADAGAVVCTSDFAAARSRAVAEASLSTPCAAGSTSTRSRRPTATGRRGPFEVLCVAALAPAQGHRVLSRR